MVDISLKKKYPFLKIIWNKYKYDEDVVESNNNVGILSLCNKDNLYENNPSDDKKNACKKLLKNFELFHNNERTPTKYFEWCKNFNNWIYYEINPYNLTDKIVHNILIEAQMKLIGLPYNQYCTYNTVNEKENLQKLIALRIFNDNSDTFQDILRNENHPNYCSCQTFLEDCVKIYRDMNELYCSKQGTRSYSREICKVITNFPILYSFLTSDSKIVKKVPKIDTGIREELIKCPSTVEAIELPSSPDTGSDTTIPKRDSTVPTALGTVAGASSVLALLYKFTPAGRFLNSGLRKSGGRMNNGLHEGYPSELGFDGMEHNLMNSYNIGYEAE